MKKEIENILIIESFEKYDKQKNPLKLSVYDLLPCGVKWKYNGNEYLINNENKIEVLLLKNNENISIIEEPYNKIKNKAYIVNGENEVKYNIKDLLLENKEFMLEYNGINIFIYEAHYIENELFYFLNINGFDYRILFDLKSGELNYKKLIFSR